MVEKDYYRRIKTAILYSKEYGNLMGKSEVGEEISQYATVGLSSTLSGCMAEELGYDRDKAAVLAMCKGMIFAPYGKAGMNYIKKLSKSENIDIKENQICEFIMNKILSDNKFKMDEEFSKSINELFSDEIDNSESGIVKNVYNMLDDILVLRKSSPSMQTKLNNKTFDILKDSIEESKKNKRICPSPKLEIIKQSLPIKEEEMNLSIEQISVLDNLWNEYKEINNSPQELVSNVITEQER